MMGKTEGKRCATKQKETEESIAEARLTDMKSEIESIY